MCKAESREYRVAGGPFEVSFAGVTNSLMSRIFCGDRASYSMSEFILTGFSNESFLSNVVFNCSISELSIRSVF